MTPDARAGRRRMPTWIWFVAVVVLVAAVGFALFVSIGLAGFHSAARHPVPTFPALADAPDPALEGTVAYFDNATRCVRIVAASGARSKDVYCLTQADLAASEALGKPAGPQLVWRPDGRLEVTLFRWVPSGKTTSPPPMTAQWQKVVDVTSGTTEEVPVDQLPASPVEPSLPLVNARGERVVTDFDAMSGRGEVTLSTASGTRTLLTVEGPGEYTYGLEPAFWSPDGEWIVTTDDGAGGRILVITPTDPAATRVLVANSGGGAGGGTAGPAFAVTSRELLGPTP